MTSFGQKDVVAMPERCECGHNISARSQYRDCLNCGRGVIERLLAKSRVVDGCLVWQGPRDRKGYGYLRIGGRDGTRVTVHRAAWIARHGLPQPQTPCVLHRCDNPPCWADEHLWLGTLADNNRDRTQKGRSGGNPLPALSIVRRNQTHCIHGHLFDAANTRIQRNGTRDCRTCHRLRERARKAALAS